MGHALRSGQALSSLPVNSGSLVPRSALFGTSHDPRPIRIQAVYWSRPHNGGIRLYDGNDIQIYSGSASGLSAVHASLNYLTVTTPITYTITGVGNANSRIILYGEVL